MKKSNKNYFENKIGLNNSCCLIRIFFVFFCIMLVFCLSACGNIASKSSLLSYAEETYGKCKVIREEHSGKGKEEIRTLYLEDNDTGLEYSVTSKFISQGLDGSVFYYSERKDSDFNEKYKNYVYDFAEKELSELDTGHPGTIMLSEDFYENKVIFDSRTSVDDSKIVCQKIAKVIANNDKKDYLSIDFLVYCEKEEICIGSYDYSTDTFKSYEPYVVIDYVYENIDKDAEYNFSISGTLDSYLSKEDLEEKGLYNNWGDFYFFISSTGVEFIAFNMEQFGKDGVCCVTKDSREKFTLSPPSH